MNQTNFGLAVVPAMSGFFSFGKRVKVREVREDAPMQLPAVLNPDTHGVTGVTKYLMATPLVTSVAKYLKKQDKHPVTGVAKYVLRQTIAERNAPTATGVAKYLVNASKTSAGHKTGVAKYLVKQALNAPKTEALTGVARYQAEQDLIAKKQAMAAKIQQYKDADVAAAKAAREAAEAAYEASRSMAQEQYEQAIETPAATGVGRYMQDKSATSKARPTATGVSKYINNKIILDSQKPVVKVSKVGKYLREQELNQSKKPNLSWCCKISGKTTYRCEAGKSDSTIGQ